MLGEADSVYAALDLLAAHFVGLLGGEPDPGELTADYRSVGVVEDDYERWLDDGVRPYAGLLRAIRTPRRRMLAYYLMGFLSGPMDVVTDRYWRDVYLGAAPLLFPGSRFVFLISAAPPAQEEAYGILECQPVGVPTQADRALAEACRGGDAEAVTGAVAAVDRPDTLDGRGMSALHLAVAYRRPAAVSARLAAGVDPNLQAEYGNAAHFAAVDRDGLVGPVADRIEDPEHWRILRALIEAGAALDAGNRCGATLLDVAIATRPYPEEWIDFLVGRGARSALTAGSCLGDLLWELKFDEGRSVEIRANQVRFLLDSGADPNEVSGAPYARELPMRSLVGYPYDSRNVPGEILVELVDQLLRHGAPRPPLGRPVTGPGFRGVVG